MPPRLIALGLVAACLVSACSREGSVLGADGTAPTPTPTIAASTIATSAVASTTLASSTTSPSPPTTTTPPPPTTTTTTTTTTTSTTTTTTTAAPSPTAPVVSGVGTEVVPFQPLDLTAEQVVLGSSVLGTPIVAERHGALGGRRVLVVGVIHGNEPAGAQIVQTLRAFGAPEGVELWLVESMNPDGQAIDDRQNANAVDLNRNFPYKWGPLGQPGDGQYAGSGPASEPETQAVVNFIAQLRPDIAIWYHQDLFVISPSDGRDGRIRARYAELTGLPMGEISTPGAVYTGIAATWARRELAGQDAVAFIVELGETLSNDEAVVHAEAVRTIAVEG